MPIAVGYRLTAQCVRRTGQTKIRPQHVGRPVHLFGEKTGAPSKHDHLIFHGAGVQDTFAQIHQAVSLINADWRNWDLDIQNCLAGRCVHHFLLDFDYRFAGREAFCFLGCPWRCWLRAGLNSKVTTAVG